MKINVQYENVKPLLKSAISRIVVKFMIQKIDLSLGSSLAFIKDFS